jgi:hypothetical protein
VLGVLIQTQGEVDTTLQDERTEKAAERIGPIRMLPIALEQKAKLIALRTAGARFGIEITQPSAGASSAFG